MKLWGGRFNKKTNELVHKLNSSITFDQRLYHYDIQGSIAHARMLASCGIISAEEGNLIIKGLNEILKELENGEIVIDKSFEDIHSLVEKCLIDKIGATGGKLHTARSRNDQVALDMRLYLRDEIFSIQKLLIEMLQVLLVLAEEYNSVIMPGYTHLQRAQPVTFAHQLLAYYSMFKRDYLRLEDNLKRVNVLPLGSGALAGTTFPIKRQQVAEELGFSEISINSIDGVSDRDFLIEFMGIAATTIMHLSRLSEEIILWSSNEFNFIELDDAYATGSSIMPQKKNPDIAELARGKAGRIYGSLIQLLTTMKGLPLAYNKDMQEDKEGVFDTIDNIKILLEIFPDMLATCQVNTQNMLKACQGGFLNATDLADYLVVKDLPFRKAHEVVGKAVVYCLENNSHLEDITLDNWKKLFPEIAEKFTVELYDYLDISNCISNRKTYGGTSPQMDKEIIEKENRWLASF